MKILAFYKVGNVLGWERDEFECLDDDLAFKRLFENREELGARFYNLDYDITDPKSRDIYGIGSTNDFETDFNDELFDGGYWTVVLAVSSTFVRKVVNYGR